MGVFKRSVGKAKKAVKKRYGFNKKSKAPKYGRIVRDVAKLAMMVNAEKKTFNQSYTNSPLGQVNINATGALCYDITPLIPQGITASTRNGASVKLSSALYQFQFNQYANLNQDQNIIIDIWKTNGTSLSTTDLLTKVYDNATFSGVIDTNSPRYQDNFSDFTLIRRVYKKLKADSVTGVSTALTFDIPIKFNKGKGHHIRLVQSLSGTPTSDITNGQIFMIVRADVGNANSTTVSTKDVPLQVAQSGSLMRFAYRTWFYDN